MEYYEITKERKERYSMMTNKVSPLEIRRAMDEVVNTKSWRKLGKALKLYGLCTAQESMSSFEPVVR